MTGEQDGGALLELTGLTKRYGHLVAVDEVTMTVRQGEHRALIGPNGAGKTTLFNLIGGVDRPTAGTIRFDGHDVTDQPEHKRARVGLAKTFQNSNLFDGMTAHENVATAVRHRAGVARRMFRPAASHDEENERAWALLDRVGLDDQAGAVAGALSHGERRQLEVAVALAIEPRLLLLDEPVAGMSTAESDRFVAMLDALPRDLTVVLIEHDMDVVFAVANAISVMQAGRLLTEGTPEEVRNSAEVQEAYLGDGGRQVFISGGGVV